MPIISRRKVTRADDCVESWVAWRAACATVEEAYRAWATAPKAHRPLAFAMYGAALDREEERAESHAAQVARRLGRPIAAAHAA